MTWLAVAVMWLVAQPPPARLVLEGARNTQATTADGIVTLRSGSGRLRYPKVFLDFEWTFQYRLKTKDTNAGVVIRSWPGDGAWPRTGYRLALPGPGANPSSLLTGRRQTVTVLKTGELVLRDGDHWQSIRIRGEGRRVSVVLNDVPLLEAELESLAGMTMFDAQKGSVELRQMQAVVLNDDRRMIDGVNVVHHSEFNKLRAALRFRFAEPIFEVRPEYTRGAMERKVQGTVEMEAVVRADGTIGSVDVIKSLDPDLDLQAIIAVRRWRFRPAILDGKPVPVLVVIEMTFTLR